MVTSSPQEKFMQLVQMPECGGFNLTWADKLRKSIAKKNPAAYEELQKEYFETVEKKGLSKNLCNYVWNVLVATSRGYGFNASHTLAYSLIALQEMNLAYKYLRESYEARAPRRRGGFLRLNRCCDGFQSRFLRGDGDAV